MTVDIDAIVTPGLGDTSYVVVSGDEAVLVDPQRDVERLLAAARARGARVRYVLETHVHNDYVSGALEARAACGARIAGPTDAGYAFDVLPMAEGEELAVGDLTLVAVPTPGHTFEHTAYLVVERGAAEPSAVLSGGSLLVGSAGRTDLLGPEHADALARAQFASVHRLAELPEGVELLPTHGAGSFCASTAPAEARTSTIGRERSTNPALAAADADTFAGEQLAGLLAYPAYYAHMGPQNRDGPPVLGGVPALALLDADEVAAHRGAGAWVVDARGGASFAAAHVPGSLNVPIDESFGSYVGWFVPFGAEAVLLVDGHDVAEEAATQLFRIGYDRVAGVLEGGVDAWAASGRPAEAYPAVGVGELLDAWRDEPEQVLDVRQRTEWDEGHLPATRHAFVGDLPARLGELGGGGPLTVACASGFRASIAASLLAAAHVPVRLVAADGVPRALELAD